MQVLVFKTNLSDPQLVDSAAIHLSAHPQIQRWNIDRHDCDNVLRIETESLQPPDVERFLSLAGFFCKELD